MKKLLIIGLLFAHAVIASAQTITDTGALRSYINTHIVTNNSRAITATALNTIFNGLINVEPNDSLSIATGSSNDTLWVWHRGTKVYFKLLRVGTAVGITNYSSLADISLTTLSDGQLAKYNAGTSKWNNFTLDKSFIGLSQVENRALSTWGGTTNVDTLGTVVRGIWNASPISDTYIASAANWNAKQPAITLGSPSQYFKGDLTLGSFTPATVGLGNVQNVDQTNAANLSSGSIPAGRYGNTTIPISAINATGGGASTHSLSLRKDGTWDSTATASTTYAALTDVALTSIANNQLVKWNAGASKWNNFTPGAGDVTGWLGYTPMNPTGTTSQYWRGNGTLATFPTDLASFSNGPGYLSGTVGVPNGGLGVATLTAYNLIAAGTTSTGPVQLIGVGTTGQVLTSNGPGALPTMQNPPTSSSYASLTDVVLTSIASNQLVHWNSGTSKWNNFTPGSSDVTGWLGYTPMNPTGTTSQYWKGNGTLGTFPSSVSFFINDVNYYKPSDTLATLATQNKVNSLLTNNVIKRIAAIDSLAKSANGMQVNGISLVPQTFDATHPGLATTALYAQTDSLHRFSDSIRVYRKSGTDSVMLCLTPIATGVEACTFQYHDSATSAVSGITQLHGDATAGPGTGDQLITFASVNSNPGTFGDATHVAQITFDSKGRALGVANVPITVAGTNLNNIPSTSSVQLTSSTGSPTTLPAATESAAGVATAAQIKRLDSTLVIYNDHTTGADTLATVKQSAGPGIPDSMLLRGRIFTSDGSIQVIDQSTASTIIKSFNLDTSANVHHALTQGMAAALYYPLSSPIVTTVGPFNSTGYVQGINISGNTIALGPADATHPGGISTGTQNIPGQKVFQATPIFNTLTTNGGFFYGGSGGVLQQSGALSGYVFGNGTAAPTAAPTIPGSAVSGNIPANSANVTGIVAIANGGTGQSTASAALAAIGGAPINNPSFTGNPQTPDQTAGNISNNIPNTRFVANAVGTADVTAGTVNSYSANHTAATTEGTIFMNSGSSTTITLTLPAASSNSGKMYYIKNTNSLGTVGLSTMGTGEINLLTPFGSPGDALLIKSDGTNWRVIASNQASVIASGNYTPSIVGITNYSSNAGSGANYLRVGNKVFVFGYIILTATASNSIITATMSLPFSSNITAALDVIGGADDVSFTGNSGVMTANTVTATAEIGITAKSTSSTIYQYSYSYTVK